MICAVETNDYDYLDSILDDPEIYASLCDDSCPPRSEFSLRICPSGTVFFEISKDREKCGFISYIPDGQGRYEQHTVLTKKCRGGSAIKAALETAALMSMRHGAKELVSFCFSDSPHTLLFASAIGFSRTGKTSKTSRSGLECEKISIRKELLCQ